MATSDTQKLEFLWFFPTNGDVRFFGRDDGARKVDNRYLRELAIALDRLGFYGALLPTGHFCEDSLVVATSLATHTERMRFLIALRPGSMVPAESVRQVATLDRLTKGRMLLNVVSGGVAGDMEADGNFLSHDERYVQSGEFLKIWRAMMSGENVTFTGKHYSCKNAQLMFPPVQAPYPPLYIGGASAAGRDLAVEQCDVYLTWGEPPAMVAETIADVRKRAAAVGREMRFGIRLHFIVRDTDEEAWKAAESLIEKIPDDVIEAAQKKLRQADAEGQQRLLGLHGGDKKKLEISPNLWAGVGLVRAGAATALVGSPETVAERIREYQSLGIDSVIGSGYPHLEEAYRVAESLFPLLPISKPPSVTDRELPESFATAGTIGLRDAAVKKSAPPSEKKPAATATNKAKTATEKSSASV
jgi:alkanesulfonate monooxygenase